MNIDNLLLEKTMMFSPQKLNFKYDDLEPYMDEETVRIHYTKHTYGYFDKTNELIKNSKYKNIKTLDELLKHPTVHKDEQLFNQAAQAWNHDFWWQSLAPAGQQPSKIFNEHIKKQYGSFTDFKKQFIESAKTIFGSGWCWCVLRKNRNIDIVQTHNADTPITNTRMTPLFVVDVWEHAYYLSYKNNREQYLKNIWNIINWEKVDERYANG